MREHRVSSTVATALLLAAVALPAQGDVPAPGAKIAPTTVEEANADLTALSARLTALFAEANRDPRWRMVDRYNAYDIAAFKSNHREVEAKDLVDIMKDEEADFQVRQAAAKALDSQKARMFDPDLATEKTGGRNPRREFARRRIVPMVKSDDAVTRKLGYDLLVAWFQRQGDPDILGFDPRTASRTQRIKCYQAWMKVLR